jgi:prepilin-type N-terminal cleavage/methylation domain-containing protein
MGKMQRGFSFLEVVVSSLILGVLTLLLVSFQISSFSAHTDQQVYSSVSTFGRRAMDRIVREAAHSLSTDPGCQTLGAVVDSTWPDVGYGYAFQRPIGATGAGTTWGEPVAFVGPGHASCPSDIAGVCRLRRLNLLAGGSYNFVPSPLDPQRGPDALFGTTDDQPQIGTGGDPELTVLVPALYAPAPVGIPPAGVPPATVGPMFQVTYDQPSRTVRFELRLNLRQGTRYLLSENLVLRETVALLN